MKQFFKMTLAVVCGLFIASIISGLISLLILSSIAALGESVPAVPSKAMLTVNLSSLSITEQQTPSNPLEMIGSDSGMPQQLAILDAVNAIDNAAEDPRISFIYLRSDGATQITACEELRKALARFRTSGKAVVSYIEAPTTLSYYLASVADKVYMTSNLGTLININGVSSQMVYLKDLLDKLGVNVQLIRHGKYKSAGEPYIRSTPSAEALEQTRAMVNSMWGVIAEEISASRGISVDALNSAIDNLKLASPEDMLAEGLVDGLLSREQLYNKVADLYVAESFEDVKSISLQDYSAALLAEQPAKKGPAGTIAVLHADGQIVEGIATQEVAGARYASLIRKLRKDDKVKAVVLRVNSPGGSVLASEQIKEQLDSLKAVKPLIASYGDYAASGGYWISNNCDKIYSDALTLTGSIGVFSIVPEFSKTLKNVAHVNVQSVSSNKHGDLMSCMRPFDADELAYMQKPVEQIYEKFTSVVAEGRDMPVNKVDEIGQGRVWTGVEALHIGLVDEIGTLSDAISYAASLAGNPELSAWKISAYPEPQTLFESIMTMFGGAPESSLIKKVEELKAPMMLARIPYELRFFRP